MMTRELKTLSEFGVTGISIRPKTYTVRFGCKAASDLADAIRGIDGAAGDYLLEVTGTALGWQPADFKEHGITEGQAWGEVTLVVRAVSEHDADRAARKILTRAMRPNPQPIS